ncbi:MAG: aldo/keto reductase [Patescibacteria group bacterium]|nr:aldo/keto reductase [Patescibacteria group bacterium]
MKYRYLGKSGLKVSRVCLGTMTFGEPEWGCGEETSLKIIDKYLDMGGNFIDTADAYNKGVSEEHVGKGLKGRRRQVILATKVFFPVMEGPNGRSLSRKHIIDSCEASLKRLNTDYIDLYQAHGPDLHTPLEETLRAFDDLVTQGKVRYLGCSNYHAWQIMKACAISKRDGFERYISAQHLYNLMFRDVEREVIPVCEDQGLGMIPWSPLAGGMLSGKYKRADIPPEGSRIAIRAKYDQKRYWNERGFTITEAVVKTAQETGHTPAQVALSWLLHNKQVSSVIVGVRDPSGLNDTMVSGDWDVPEEQWKELDNVAFFDHGYPQSWQDMMYPQMYGDIEL